VSLRLLSYNIRYGGLGREDVLAAVIRTCAPDLVVFQEATRPEVVKRLAADCGMAQFGARLGESLAWMSRLEIEGSVWHRPLLARRSYLELRVDGLRIFGVHLAAIHSNLTEQRRVWEIRRILASSPKTAHVILGDFNSIAPGEHFSIGRLPRRLQAVAWATGGPIRWRTIQILRSAGYLDGYRLFQDDPGYTFPSRDPQVRLDYCFVPDRNLLTACTVINRIPQAREASDHFPLMSELAMP
jgi:endonuclease/exonuclease/phosphatase family metal-dependent hydrolase